MNGRVCALVMDIARREAAGAILDAMALMRFIQAAKGDELMDMLAEQCQNFGVSLFMENANMVCDTASMTCQCRDRRISDGSDPKVQT